MCERELETEQNCNILTPTLMAISISFPFSWAAQLGAWGPSLSGCWFSLLPLSPTGLVSKTHLICNCSIGGPEGSLCWVPAFSTTSCLQTGLVSKLTDFLSSPSYIIVQRLPSSCGHHNFALIQPVPGQGYNILNIPRQNAPVIYIGAFPILTAWPGRRSIYNKYIESLPLQ